MSSDFLLVDNHTWYADMPALHFVGHIGRHFRLAAMMARDSVKTRLESPVGISFTEFSYQVLQVACS